RSRVIKQRTVRIAPTAAASPSGTAGSSLSAVQTRTSRIAKSRNGRRQQMRSPIFALTAFIVLTPVLASGQGQAAYKAPKTPWGDPDIQGQWPAAADIPMQRPASLGTRAILTDEELAQREK